MEETITTDQRDVQHQEEFAPIDARQDQTVRHDQQRERVLLVFGAQQLSRAEEEQEEAIERQCEEIVQSLFDQTAVRGRDQCRTDRRRRSAFGEQYQHCARAVQTTIESRRTNRFVCQ